jgi:hypothetical protein
LDYTVDTITARAAEKVACTESSPRSLHLVVTPPHLSVVTSDHLRCPFCLPSLYIADIFPELKMERTPRDSIPSPVPQSQWHEPFYHQTGLIRGDDFKPSVPLLKDERPWVRWPVTIFYRIPVSIIQAVSSGLLWIYEALIGCLSWIFSTFGSLIFAVGRGIRGLYRTISSSAKDPGIVARGIIVALFLIALIPIIIYLALKVRKS